MQTQTAWATGFLTQLLLNYLERHYPAQTQAIDPRTYFSGIEGYESLKDPRALLLDSHAWLPEEVLREVLRTAERVAGRKEIAYEAAVDYFTRSARGDVQHIPSIFEIMARSFDDVRNVALYSGHWAGAYTTFMKLQAVSRDPAVSELIILSQCDPGFRPLLATHFMLKGNYEGFVRLYDFIEEARFEEEFLQYRIRDIVSEFDGYAVEEEGEGLKIVENRGGRTVAVFRRAPLNHEEIPLTVPLAESVGAGAHPTAQAGEAVPEGWILMPQVRPDGQVFIKVLIPPSTNAGSRDGGAASALRVVQGGALRAGGIEYVFREDTYYDAPYSRYRFRWRERQRAALPSAGPEARIQKMAYLLFAYLQELKITQQRLLAYAAENKALAVENVYLRREVQEVNQGWTSPKPLGESPAMRAVLNLVNQVAPADSTVLITGETGTGKEVIARRIHLLGDRRDRRFVAINCGAVPEGLLESELFGHERGAFTGAQNRKIGKFEWANGGTLFLDEIGEIPLPVQVKLLRVLQERELMRVGGNDPIPLDVRILAATNQDLKALIQKGSFRKDLYYRLNVIPVHLPPLRERLDDLPALADYFLVNLRRRLRKDVRTLSPIALNRMRAYSWPGNIRELENVLERAVTLIPASQTVLTPDLFPLEVRDGDPFPVVTPSLPSQQGTPAALPNVKEMFDRFEWQALVDAMRNEGSMDSFLRKIEWAMAQRAILEYGSKTEAARVLNRTYRWIRKLEKEMEDKPSV